jgi:hypothetical protein
VGSALVALFLLAAEPGIQTGAVSEAEVRQGAIVEGLFPSALAVSASIESQSRAGETPITPGANPQSFVAELLFPRLALDLRRPDIILAAWYGPRIFWEDPTPPGTSGTLVLHTFGVNLQAPLSRIFRLTGSALGSIGEPDYTTLQQVLGTAQGALPGTTTTVVKLGSVAGQAMVEARVARRWQLSLDAQASYWRWLDAPPMPLASAITGQTAGRAELGALFRLTPLDDVGLSVAVGDASYSNGTALANVTAAAIWRTRLARREDLRVTLGVTYAHVVGTTPFGAMPLLGASQSVALPIGSVDLVSRLTRRDDILFLGHMFAGVDFYADPVLGSGVPRGFGALEVATVTASGWATGLRGDFAAALRTTPYPVVLPAIPPDETAFSLSLFVRRRVTEYLFAELGGRWADRGPALVTPDFQFHQRQLWIYLSVTGTTRPIPRAALPVQ